MHDAVGRKTTIVDPKLGPLTDDRLTRDVRVYQRERGHRFSADDVATAFIAAQTVPQARRVLDLGCGLGSVLLHLAWSLPNATLVGIEAQEVSFELLQRNLARSGYASRIQIHLGDLRVPEAIECLGTNFDLITGTPPYFPPTAALDAEDVQRAYARVEYRGGVEAYVKTATQLLSVDGTIVLCTDARSLERVRLASEESGGSIRSRCDVIPREGRPALFSIWTLERTLSAPPSFTRLVLRDAQGTRTVDAQRLREFSGF
jgi:tRNA1(Val) A37 N6-methylase TrmN6